MVVDHGLGVASLYGHLSSIAVQPGQQVKTGETLGQTGETGLAGGDHLHFSIMLRGVHIDPVEWWDPLWIREHVAARLTSCRPPRRRHRHPPSPRTARGGDSAPAQADAAHGQAQP